MTTPETRLREIHLVLKATSEKEFTFLLAGDIERIDKLKEDELSAVEFWAKKLMEVSLSVLHECGVIQGATAKKQTHGGSEEKH